MLSFNHRSCFLFIQVCFWVLICFLIKVQCVLFVLLLGCKSPYVSSRSRSRVCWLWVHDAHWATSGQPGTGSRQEEVHGALTGKPLRCRFLESLLACLISVTSLSVSLSSIRTPVIQTNTQGVIYMTIVINHTWLHAPNPLGSVLNSHFKWWFVMVFQ